MGLFNISEITKKTTLNLDAELMKLIKLKALELNITQTELITLYLKNGLINNNKIVKVSTERKYKHYLGRFTKKKQLLS